MRIYSSTLWVLSAAIFNKVVANNTPTFIFIGETFRGELIAPNQQSSIFVYSEIEGGHTFTWNQTDGGHVEVLQVDLMNNETHAIASWCDPADDCSQTPGMSGSFSTRILSTMTIASHS